MVLIDRLRQALGEAGQRAPEPEQARHIAAAVLMLEMAHADNQHQHAENAEIEKQLQSHFGLSSDETSELMAEAQSKSDESVSLYRYLKLLNESMSLDDKLRVLEMLWRVAYADKQLDPQEERLMRELAELLYLPHSEFIRAKLRVTGA